MEQLQSKLFRLTKSDFVKGLITAILAAVVVVIYGVVNTPNFDLFAIDWATTSHAIANASTAAFFAYLAKNFVTDSNGKVAGVI